MTPTSEYGRLSLAAKQARHREAMREPAIPCPRCETMTMPADLLRHVESCPGQREPHPLNRWASRARAAATAIAAALAIG